jgi:hypothetical protein
MIVTNLIAAKAKRCVLNVAPAGCGKSATTDIVEMLTKGNSQKYTSLTLAGLMRIKEQLTDYMGHIIIDDLGAEKSQWSRTSTVTVLATVVHTHYIYKITQAGLLQITNFQGSASLNIQPVLMNALVQEEDWIAVVRDKVLRYYHMVRPLIPKDYIPKMQINWGIDYKKVNPPRHKGKLWYQLISIGLTQWSYARCLEHIPAMLRASAALDDREEVREDDYRLLIKLLKPMQLERYIISSYGFEEGRTFQNNTYCILVELVSHGEPTVATIAEDYKVSPPTVERLLAASPEWCFKKSNSPTRILPTDQAKKILTLCGAYQKW